MNWRKRFYASQANLLLGLEHRLKRQAYKVRGREWEFNRVRGVVALVVKAKEDLYTLESSVPNDDPQADLFSEGAGE